MVKRLLSQAYRLSSSHGLFIEEVEQIQSNLARNGYPISFTKNISEHFIQSRGITEDSYKAHQETAGEEPNEEPLEANEKLYMTVPYLGKPSIELQRRIGNELRKHGVNVTAAYRTTKVGSYFSLKTRCSKLFSSNVVYQFNCSQDEKISYVGETRRQLFRRAEDHIKTDKKSAVFEHLFVCTSCQNVKNIMNCFKIISTANAYNILSLEAMLIAVHQPILNTQLGPGKGAQTSLSLY